MPPETKIGSVLFAKATETTLNGLRTTSPAPQSGSFSPRFPCLMIDVAPKTSSVLSCSLPRFEIVPSLSLPPLECARGLCHIASATGTKCRRLMKGQAAATAVRHVLIAAARSTRCVWADVRWRWTLKVLWTAACVERNFWAEPGLLNRCILRSRRRVG